MFVIDPTVDTLKRKHCLILLRLSRGDQIENCEGEFDLVP